MDPVQKMWMFENWQADHNDQAELAKNHAYLLASFWNPEAVKDMIGDNANVHQSTDEEFEESTRMIKEINESVDEMKQIPTIKNKRRRAKLKNIHR